VSLSLSSTQQRTRSHETAARLLAVLEWTFAAMASMVALQVARIGVQLQPANTPIDRQLPLLGLAITILAWLVRDTPWWSAVQSAVLLLIGCVVALPGDRLRLMAYGVVVAVTFCGALLAAGELTLVRSATFALVATAVLRWLLLPSASVMRETLLAMGVVAIVAAFGRRGGPVGIAVAVAAALYTPAIPLRTLAIPFAVAVVVLTVRLLLARRGDAAPLMAVRAALDAAGLLMLAFMLTLFAWSGIAARQFPFFRREYGVGQRDEVRQALVPGQSLILDIPEDGVALIVSGANMARLRRGTIVGRVDPGGWNIHLGDLADWGYARRDQWWKSTNGLPRRPAGLVREYGYDGWVDGAGRIVLPRHLGRLTITCDPQLPAEARLQVEAIERGAP
jgi:hypothetical protein